MESCLVDPACAGQASAIYKGEDDLRGEPPHGLSANGQARDR